MAGVGGHALSALACQALLRRARSSAARPYRVGAAIGCVWIIALHSVLSLPASFTVPQSYRLRQRALNDTASRMAVGEADSRKVVALLSAPSFFDALSVCTFRQELAPVRPWRAVHILGSGKGPLMITRVEETSLQLEPTGGFLSEPTSQQARSPEERFQVGQVISLDGIDVSIERLTSDGRPKRVKLQWARDAAEVPKFLAWSARAQTYVEFHLPHLGERAQL